jgi:dTDP-4-dehydrorhamnose 3,5-epimerase
MAHPDHVAVRRPSSAGDIFPSGTRDVPTVTSAGEPRTTHIEGVKLARLAPLVDHRGSLVEVINFDHPFWDEPVVYAYTVTIRPGRIKGWGMHRLQADRYFLSSGNGRVVLFDGRVDSPSHRRLSEFHFGDASPGLLRIPPGVWHADQNYGDDEVTFLNFPTRPYEHSNPDKYRIDPHSDEIPFDWSLRDG